MAVTQQVLTARLNKSITILHGTFRTQGTLTDDGSAANNDAIVVTPISGEPVTIPKASIAGIG